MLGELADVRFLHTNQGKHSPCFARHRPGARASEKEWKAGYNNSGKQLLKKKKCHFHLGGKQKHTALQFTLFTYKIGVAARTQPYIQKENTPSIPRKGSISVTAIMASH